MVYFISNHLEGLPFYFLPFSGHGHLVSIVLFGSAAEGRMRPSSDVNLILVTKEFDVSQVNRLREVLRVAYAAIRMNVMFILESEISVASEAFAVKFTDILNRNRILFGSDPFKNMEVSRAATLQRLRQVTVNLMLRLRERYALVSLREEQLVPIIADVAGPIRASAATILGLEGKKGIRWRLRFGRNLFWNKSFRRFLGV